MRARTDFRALTALAALAALLGAGCVTTATRLARDLKTKQARSHLDLGVDHLANGRTALGLRDLLQSEELDPDNPQTHYALGVAYQRKGKMDQALSHLQRALEIHPAHHEVRLHLSALYSHLGRYDEAIIEAELLFEDPTFLGPWRALTQRGWAHYKLGHVADARRDLQLAYEYANGQYWKTLLNLGILEHEDGHRLEAIDLFQGVLTLEPGPSAEAEANYRLAEIYISLGKRDRAMNHLMAAVAQTPGGRWGKKSEEYLKRLR